MQPEPGVFDVRWAVLADGKQLVEFALKLRKNLGDDFVFAAVVVVQIAWRNIHFVGNRIGGHIRLTKRVEHAKRHFENALFGTAGGLTFHGWLHGRFQCSVP